MKRLRVARQTIRRLQDDGLAAVRAGMQIWTVTGFSQTPTDVDPDAGLGGGKSATSGPSAQGTL